MVGFLGMLQTSDIYREGKATYTLGAPAWNGDIITLNWEYNKGILKDM